jgi:hypothetical protein
LTKDNLSNDTDQLVQQFCTGDDLSTYDPYDIWKTGLGIHVKNLFNSSRMAGALPALCLTVYDNFINNTLRWGYQKQEYPIVRALAAQTLLIGYKKTNDQKLRIAAEKHLEWLRMHISTGYAGACWGLGFTWAASKDIIYSASTPHTTHTPYALEAFDMYTETTGDARYRGIIESCFRFYEKDVCIMFQDERMMAVSYGSFHDRTVTNASAYTLFAYTIFFKYLPGYAEEIRRKIRKLYQFIVSTQQENGSWYYSPDDKSSFIDCFHSCLVVKNLIKANEQIPLEGVETLIQKGYAYIKVNFFSTKTGLYKRFSKKNKPSFTKFDLYDNAEFLHLANRMEDHAVALELEESIKLHFIKGGSVYSVIDLLGRKRNKNTLRWAVMPYLFSLSNVNN